MVSFIRSYKWPVLLLIASLCAAGTAGGAGKSYRISLSVTGLVPGAGIVLVNNGTEELSVAGNGSHTFKNPQEDGSAYEIAIRQQPDSLRCMVTGGSGTVKGADIKNVSVTCPMAYRNSLVWMRCTNGQVWNAARGDCTGTGKPGSFGAVQVRFCGTNDNACNGGSDAGDLSSGEAFEACSKLNRGSGTYGLTSWRLPSKDELASLVVCTDGTAVPLRDYGSDPYKCGWKGKNYSNGGWKSPALDNGLFPNSLSLEYWSGSPNGKNRSSAWYTAFQNGWTHTAVKSGRSYVRCVAGPQ